MKSALVFAGPHRPWGWSQCGTTVLMPALVAPSVSYTRRPRAQAATITLYSPSHCSSW